MLSNCVAQFKKSTILHKKERKKERKNFCLEILIMQLTQKYFVHDMFFFVVVVVSIVIVDASKIFLVRVFFFWCVILICA